MYTHKPTVFNQMFRLVRDTFSGLVGQLDRFSRKFDTESLLKVMLFAQSTGKQSLRDIEVWLQWAEWKLYHMWLQSIARSTISYKNNHTDSSLYEKLFYALYEKYSSCINKSSSELDLWIKAIALDGSLISVALWSFNRAKYRTSKGWIKLHLWLDISANMPRFCVITDGKKWETIVAKQIINDKRLNSWEIIVFDRWYVDFSLRKLIADQQSFFLTRTKTNIDYTITQNHEIVWDGITLDSTVELFWTQWQKKYSEPLRVVRFTDKETKKEYEYITNNFELSASQIALLYKNRRKIETFFKRIKQHLKIKSFLWTSENAVKNQIRIALIYYLLLKYLSESVSLWKQQIIKFFRLLSNNILNTINMSELYVICRSKTSSSLSSSPPLTWLFS